MAQTFNESELMERVDNDVAFLAETVEMLTSDGPPLLEQLDEAVGAGDAPAVGRLAHTLKGMISNFCAPQIQACALELEKMGKAGDLTGAAPALATLRERMGVLMNELLGFVKARA